MAKRKNDGAGEAITGREKKKQKTALARTIEVQPGTSFGTAQNAVAGPSTGTVRFEGGM